MQTATRQAIDARPPRPARWRAATALASIVALAPIVALALGALLIAQGAYIHVKAAVAQVLLERAFAQTLATGAAVKPWSWADTWPVARVAAPRLRASAIVLAGASGQALAFGPGQIEHTPEAGEDGVAVYSAHRDTHFAFLAGIRVGDDLEVTRRDGRLVRFRVTGTSVARFDRSGIDPHAAGRGLVLVTCWPLDAVTQGPLRYLVHARMIDDNAAP
jgi:sortase A